MKVASLPYSRELLQQARKQLDDSTTSSLTKDDWELARRRPVYNKAERNAVTFGLSWSIRHARRHFAAGERTQGTLCALSTPFSATAMVGGAVIGSMFAAVISDIFRAPRSPEGVKEDRTARALDAAMVCLHDAVGPAGIYRLENHEVTLIDLATLLKDARELHAAAELLCRRWPNATHSPDFARTLKALSRSITALDAVVAARSEGAAPVA